VIALHIEHVDRIPAHQSAKNCGPRSSNFYRATKVNKPLTFNAPVSVRRTGVSASTLLPIKCLFYAYYTFVFTLPLQVINIGISDFGVSKLLELPLIGLSLTRPKLCFRRPPKAFRCFSAYVAVYTVLSLPLILDPETTGLASSIISQLFTQVQLLVLFWVSFNLLRSDWVKKATLFSMAASCIFISIALIVGGQTGVESSVEQTGGGLGEQEGRESAFGANPNKTATVLALGLLSLVGLAYGQRQGATKMRILCWLTGPLLLVTMVRTGSRGNLIALVLALFALVMKPRSLRQNLKAGLVVLLAVISVAFASYQIEFVRERWERTIEDGDTAGREEIFAEAWDMFLESPMIGWGPVNHLYELGPRVGQELRDPHNIYLWVLNETGVVGAIPFFAGLWFSVCCAWRARKGAQGVVPIAMLGYLLLANLKGSGHMDKYFWVALAYTVAAGSRFAVIRYRYRSHNTARVDAASTQTVIKQLRWSKNSKTTTLSQSSYLTRQ
jgi:O-antigen ligase